MSFPLNQRRPSTSDGQRRKPAWLPTHPPPRPKRPSTQRFSGHSRLVLSLLQLLFPSLFPLVTLTAVAANIPIRRRRVLKSREAPRRADKIPQIPSRAQPLKPSDSSRWRRRRSVRGMAEIRKYAMSNQAPGTRGSASRFRSPLS